MWAQQVDYSGMHIPFKDHPHGEVHLKNTLKDKKYLVGKFNVISRTPHREGVTNVVTKVQIQYQRLHLMIGIAGQSVSPRYACIMA